MVGLAHHQQRPLLAERLVDLGRIIRPAQPPPAGLVEAQLGGRRDDHPVPIGGQLGTEPKKQRRLAAPSYEGDQLVRTEPESLDQVDGHEEEPRRLSMA